MKKNHVRYGRDLVITVKLAQFLTDKAQSGTNRFRISWRTKKTKKTLMLWCDLVITVKLAQFFTDRAHSGTSRFRILPGVS